jgi:ureidoglycolate lyase
MAQPLTAAAFSAFGDVIECSDRVESFKINRGFTTRFHNLAKVDVTADNGEAIISILRTQPLGWPVIITMMERHPLGSQAFISLSNNPYLVVVAPKGKLDLSQIKVFLAQGNQGVNYHKGTWHHFCLALNEVSDFLVVDRQGPGNNCNVITISPDQTITIKMPTPTKRVNG